jgi:hypothetical protein
MLVFQSQRSLNSLEADEGDPGCQNLTEEEIAMDVSASLEDHCDSDDETAEKSSKLSEVRGSLNVIISHIHQISNVVVQPCY